MKRTHNFKSNITTCLENYGDCREINLIKNLLILIDEFDNFLKLLEQDDFQKMEEIIINQTRLISLDIYIKGHIEKPLPYVHKYLYNDEYLDENDKLNRAEMNKLKVIKGKKMIFLENHVLNINIDLKNSKLILHDLLYKKNNLIFDKDNIYDYLYSADYYFDKRDTFLDDKNKLLDLGVNFSNDKVIQLGLITYNLFQTFKIDKINPHDYYYLSNPYKLHKDFYDVNKFVIWREKKMYYNRIKYFNKSIMLKDTLNQKENIEIPIFYLKIFKYYIYFINIYNMDNNMTNIFCCNSKIENLYNIDEEDIYKPIELFSKIII